MKPNKQVIPTETALRDWRDPEFQYSEKCDGVFSTRTISGTLLAGEQMKSGAFIAFDVLARDGDSLTAWPLRDRWGLLLGLQAELTRAGGRIVETAADGADLLARVLSRGGEGVCAKRWADSYGPMLAAKRISDWLCRITNFCGGSESVEIADAATGEPRGKVSLLGGKVDQVRVGSILKVTGFALHASGKIREPRLDKDTPDSWLVQF